MSDEAATPDGLRVSDADREQVAEALRAHAGAGRLDTDELEERVRAAYSARTRSELDALHRDLPALPPAPPTRAEQKAVRSDRRKHLARRMVAECGGSLGLFAVCTALWLVNGAHGHFWPVWVLIVFVMALVRNGSTLLGNDEALDRAEDRLDRRDERRAARDERRDRRR